MNNMTKYVNNKRGSMTLYVTVVFAIFLVTISVLMAILYSSNAHIKVKTKLTQEESSAVNNIKSTFNEYKSLSVLDKKVEEIEYNGRKYTLEMVPTTKIKKKKVEKEFKITNNKVNSENYYAYDTNYTASESQVTKQDVYNTVTTLSNIDANNNTNNQYVIYGNQTYGKTTTNILPTDFKGMMNNSTVTANKVPSNYVNVGQWIIQNRPDTKRVRVTKDNNEFKYVANYPSSVSFPFASGTQGIFLVEYLNKNNELVAWSRFSHKNQPNSIVTNIFAPKSFLTNSDLYRPLSSKNSDVSVNTVKNANLYRELPKYYSSLTEVTQSLIDTHTTHNVADYKTTGVSFNYTWDYLDACITEEVTGYPFKDELQTTKEKVITELNGSNCVNNQSKVNYDVSLSKGRANKISYPLYTNWSTLPTSEVEKVFTFYKQNWSDMFACIKGVNSSNSHYCESQNAVPSSQQSIYKGSYNRQNIKENFLFCSMDGYKVAVIDSNERWVKYANKMHDEIITKAESRFKELEREAYAKAKEEYEEEKKAIDEAHASAMSAWADAPVPEGGTKGPAPEKPPYPDPPANPLEIIKHGELPTKPTFAMNNEKSEKTLKSKYRGVLTFIMPKYMSGGFDSGEIVSSTWTTVDIDVNKVIRKIVEDGNYKQKFESELAKQDVYKVPCLPKLQKDNKNYKFTADEIPYVNFNLDIITNVATGVKITTEHSAEVDNARTEYALNFYDGVNPVSLYKETKKNSKEPTYRTFNETKKVSVKPNYPVIDFKELGRDASMVQNRLQFQFTSFNRNLERVKVEYEVIESMEYGYHIYNDKGERLYYTTIEQRNSL